MSYIKFKKSKGNRIKFETDSSHIKDFIKSKFTIPNPTAKYSKWGPENISAITPLGSFLPGLCLDIIELVRNEYPEIDIDTSDVESVVKPFSFKVDKLKNPENKNFKYRDYQEEVIKIGLEKGTGTVIHPTASGKSLSIYGLIKNIWNCKNRKLKTLILVPNIQLVKQFYGDLLDYGCSENDICMFSSFSKDINNESIIISNRQWLENHSDELPKIETLITDECLKKGSLIKTINGYKKIEEIVVGDQVLSYNIKEGKKEEKKVLKTFNNLPNSTSYDYFLKITMDNGQELKVTPNHKIYTRNRGYVRAEELTYKDDVEIL